MKIGRTLFVSSALFGFAIAISYWFSSRNPDGTFLLGLMAGALTFAAGYMFFAERGARLIGDRGDATNHDGEGERLGVFTSNTPWPLITAFGAFAMLVGMAIFHPLGYAGLLILLYGVIQLGRESR
ncbi:MAG: cytochrome c oxidase subunit 4 [Candidatus Eremiobacteraeota bacterium]|nr:cytochrome c oxidase subunit 4 [Candidatus Eremiobacteraeota bacterium]